MNNTFVSNDLKLDSKETEKILTEKATTEIKRRIVILKAGAHFWIPCKTEAANELLLIESFGF